MQRMESERKAYFEGVERKKAVDRDAKAAAFIQQAGKKAAKSVRHEIEAPLGMDSGQSGSWFQLSAVQAS